MLNAYQLNNIRIISTLGKEKEEMNEELYDLYKRDPDFREYVDTWCKVHNLGIFEALSIKILQEYGKEKKKEEKNERHS